MKLKLFIYSILGYLIFINPVHSQDTSSTYWQKMDSLHHLIETKEEEDEEKVRLMNEYARLCFYNQNYHAGFVSTYAARQLSESLEYEEGIIMYYLTLAGYHENDDMRTFYQKKAQWLSRRLDEQLDKYSTYISIPGYKMGDEFEESINHFTETLQYFVELGDIEIQANILFGLAYFNYQLDNKEEVVVLTENAQKLFTQINEVYPVFLLSINRMNDLIASDKAEEAKEIEFELIELITRHENEKTIGLITNTMATNYRNRGRWALAIEYYLKSLEVINQFDDLKLLSRTFFFLGISYENLNMNSKAADSYKKSITALTELQDNNNLYNAYGTLVFPLIALKKYDEARKYMTLALHDTITDNKTYVLARYNDAEGQIFLNQGQYENAIVCFNKAFEAFNQLDYNRWAAPFMKLYLAECYLRIDEYDKALKEGLKCLEMENELNSNNTIVKRRVSLLLSEIYDQIGDLQMAYEYLKMHQEIRAESDKLDEANRIADAEVQSILDKSQKEIDGLEKEKLQKEQESRIQRLWIFSITGALLSALLLSIVLYRNNQNKQRANATLKEQKEEIETTLEILKSTQSQLIQSEKMASLGELTAGIAHEIQNPLNFVNNFSDLNSELLQEMVGEIKKGNTTEAIEIASDIITNEKKIWHHGKRAESIVKNMLQHSRGDAGKKVPTDINAMVEEYVNLAFHGMRARDKSFNSDYKIELDKKVPLISIVPQDIGRVILNLVNNAFYAVYDKRLKNEKAEYNPVVHVSTKLNKSAVVICVRDNGLGIADSNKDKIFQPFFTTKPAGQGTGLGLSLSYDIVKAHGGDIKVISPPAAEEGKDNEGTEFIIIIPITSNTLK